MPRIFLRSAALAMAAAWTVAPALAGTFKTITIDDAYADWTGVPVVDADPADNFSGPDIADTQIANDGQYLYIRNTFHNSLALGTFLSIDVDGDTSTGFDIFSLGLLGAEAGWQNDFGFAQATGTFNSGGLSGDFFGGGHALLSPFANAGSRELAISLAALRTGGLPIFPDDTVKLLFWTDLGTGADGLPPGFPGDDGRNFDVTAVMDYKLAVPEPSAFALTAITLIGFGLRRRGAC
ncbi:PEP-CTERM sorting domain-containing protein [Lacipirellula limnantheis]|uniref:Ice-binding protein C-terminal domain-containing protein n=1 Tax=Lacipirellula limnantheis TaxID=2528024 RepID=A0A517TSN4_9BACT|nr:PEP-CTERM sorting domain-containing protein [Lacipirellula limnantheis]QDT71385.1 hypothetical protein I41_05420 [Lacipirellula limnantheis]